MRAPEVYLSTEGFAVPYEELWPFLHSSWESLKRLPLRHVGETYLVMVQEFYLNGVKHVRRALLCMIDPKEYRIFPHEDTFPEGVAFYRELARNFPFQFAPIMLIGEDEDGILQKTEPGDPLFEGEFYGVKSYLYTAKVRGRLPREMVIADGHHRFSAYSMEGEVFVAFMDARDPALRILPTHRGLHVSKATLKRYLRREDVLKRTLRGMGDEYFEAFPVILKGRSSRPIGLKFHVSDGPLSEVPAYLSDNVLLRGRYEHIAGYERHSRNALERLYSGEYDFVLFLRATTPMQVLKVARAGLRMPRKSTDFFPKLVAGPVFVR